ncbi:MAG: fibronectin type III domain-containing protein, partial [Candidatus Schekmanbacteria bacterium]
MKKTIKIILLFILILPLLGAVGLTGGNTSGCKKKKDKNTRIEKGDVNVIRRGSKYYVYGEVKNKKNKWLSGVSVKISLFDENGGEITSKIVDVIGLEPRRIPSLDNSIKENVIKKGKKGYFVAVFPKISQSATSSLTETFSKKRKTLKLRGTGNLKIKPKKVKVRNRKIKGRIINNASIPLWDVKVYALVKNSSGDIISFESDYVGSTEDINGIPRDNVLNPNDEDSFNINTKIDEDNVNVGDIMLWATWQEDKPSAPTAPEDLVITTTTEGKPLLSWTDASDDEDGFKIYKRKENKNNYTLIDTIKTSDKEGSGGIETYEDTDIKSGKTYYYAITAYKKGRPYLDQKILNSSFSNKVKFTAP